MASFLPALDLIIDWLLRTSFQAAIVAVLVLTLNVVLRRWTAASARYGLLLLVAARLLMPAAPPSRWSIFNFVGDRPAAQRAPVVVDAQPTGEWVISKEPLSQPLPVSSINIPKPSAAMNFGWKSTLAAMWLAGIVLVLVRIAHANIKLSRKLRGAKLLVDTHLLHLLQSCKSQMKINRVLPILETNAIESPALMGPLRPRLLLPIGLCDRLTIGEMRFIFLHELAHLKRNDIAMDWLLAILQSVHWFNPLIYLAFARARAERELARDAMVLRLTRPEDELGYGQAILKLIENFGRLGPRPGTIGILEGNAGKRQLKRRITMIADFKRSNTLGAIVALALALVLIGCALTDKKAAATADIKPAAAEKPAPTEGDDTHPNPTAKPAAAERDVDATMPDDKAKRDAAAQAILDRRIPQVRFNTVVITDALDFLRDVSGANFYVNWKNLQTVGIEKTTTVTANLRDVRFSKALATILDDAGGAGPLGFDIEDGVIVIDTKESLDKNTVVQVYDIRDLIVGAGDEKQTEALVKEVTSVIENTIDKNSWEQNGGAIGGIKQLKGQLIVTQTKANHKQIALLLGKLREASAVQISVRSHLIKAPLAILKEIGLEVPKFELPLRTVGRPGKPGNPIQGQFLEENQVDQLFKAIGTTPEASIVSSPRITLFNGQQGSISIGQEIPYITGWTAPKDGRRDPQTSYVKTGFIFNLRGYVSADRKYVTMSMQPRIARLRKMEQVPWPQSPAEEKLTIQKPDLAVQEVDEMVSIPDNGTLLTILTENEEGKDAKGTVNILLVRPSIIIPRELEQKEAAGKPGQ